MRRIKKAFSIMALGAMVIACENGTIDTDKFSKEYRNLSFSGPLANIHFTADDLIKETADSGMFYKDKDDLIYRTFSHQIDLDWDSLVRLKDLAYHYEFSPSGMSILKSIQANTGSIKLLLNDSPEVRYDSSRLTSAFLSLRVDAPSGATGTVTITIPEIILSNNQMLTYVFDISNTTNQYYEAENLTDIRIKCSQAIDSSFITLNINPQLVVSDPGPISPLAIDFKLNQMKPEITFGYFGQKTVEEKELDVKFNFFEHFDLIEKVKFADIQLKIQTENHIGTPFRLEVDSVWFSDTTANINQKLLLDDRYFDITPAEYAIPVHSKKDSFLVNGSNSNVLDILDMYPNYVVCNIKGTSNPDNLMTNNFLNHHNKLNTTLQLNFPFWFKTTSYSRTDTVEFDFNEYIPEDPDKTDAINRFQLFLDFYNGFAFEMSCQGIVTDDNYQLIDSLFSSGPVFIHAAVPDANNTIKEQTHTEIVVNISQEQLERFRDNQATHVIFHTQGATFDSGNDFIKIFGKNKMDISISANLDVKYTDQ